MMGEVVYWSAPDGSWGACPQGSLVIVPARALSADMLAAIEECSSRGDDTGVREALRGAAHG